MRSTTTMKRQDRGRAYVPVRRPIKKKLFNFFTNLPRKQPKAQLSVLRPGPCRPAGVGGCEQLGGGGEMHGGPACACVHLFVCASERLHVWVCICAGWNACDMERFYGARFRTRGCVLMMKGTSLNTSDVYLGMCPGVNVGDS